MRRNHIDAFGTQVALYVLIIALLVVSCSKTWNFIRTPEFVPDQNILYDLFLFILYEGGAVLWLHLATHSSDNVVRYFVAWGMFGLSMLAVLTAMFYEMNGVHNGLVTHDFLVQYAPSVTSNTFFADLIMVVLYMTANHKTVAHHRAIRDYGWIDDQEYRPNIAGDNH